MASIIYFTINVIVIQSILGLSTFDLGNFRFRQSYFAAPAVPMAHIMLSVPDLGNFDIGKTPV